MAHTDVCRIENSVDITDNIKTITQPGNVGKWDISLGHHMDSGAV